MRKRALEALTNVLQHPPPSPSLDHPAADLCAETGLLGLNEIVQDSRESKKQRGKGSSEEHQPGLMHALQLVKSIAAAARGWPSKRIDALCEVLLAIAKTSNEYLAMASFEVFEAVFEGMADEVSSAKLPRLMEAITDLKPSSNDSQLLPPWIAVLSRGYDVSAQINPEETFLKLPELFGMIAEFLDSISHNIRVSAGECLVSFAANCIPPNLILEPSVYDEMTLEKIAKVATGLLSVQYQAAWMEVFTVLSALFETFKWQSSPIMNDVVRAVGELRGSDSFNGKKEADEVLGKAIEAMGPEAVLKVLPLNLAKPKAGQTGRVWLLPLLRDNVINTNIAHFKSELVPLSESMFQRVIDFGQKERTMETKIYETIVSQAWACLPGYCSLPLDLVESFDQSFAELLSNLLYKQTELRVDVCKALQTLVEQNKEIADTVGKQDLLLQRRITRVAAQKNIEHLASFAANLLAVLFNVYSETLPHHRGYILQCVNAYLSITPEPEVMETFTRVTTMLEAALQEATSQTQADKQKEKQSANKMPPTSHTLMDLVITMSIYLPASSFATVFQMASLILPQSSDPQLQKKAYKLIPRLATSGTGAYALQTRNEELQAVLISSASSVSAPARRDRLAALSTVIEYMPPHTLHFVPSVLSEVVIATKEVNERARTAAFDLLVLMGNKMSAGGTIDQSKIPHMDADAPTASASIEEFFTIISAGLAGSTPHMISASITALTRVLYEFRKRVPEAVLEDMVQTMDLFLTSSNREIVRSVLGFVKVAIISLPENIIAPRLESLVTGLMGWSKEHKARFRSKVKHIFERLIRRVGFEKVERYCPEADKKLLANIRKTKERKKRKKDAAAQDGEEEDQQIDKRRGKFESEFDQAVYGNASESDSDAGDAESDDELEAKGGKRGQKGGKAYIVEDEDEPLDLLDRKALGRISSTKPLKPRMAAESRKRAKAKVDLDGKLVIGGGDDEGDAEMGGLDAGAEEPQDGGIDAYVHAIKGRDAVQKGRGGRLKFSNKRENGGMELDEDDDDSGKKKRPARRALDGRKNKSGSGRGHMGTSAGRVVKSRGRGPRGRR